MMFDISNSIIYFVIFDILVVVTIGYYYYFKRKKRKKKVPNPIKSVQKGITLHRCQHCDSVFEHPIKEIVYITDPPTVKLKCPKCENVLVVLSTGRVTIGLQEYETPEVTSIVELVAEEV